MKDIFRDEWWFRYTVLKLLVVIIRQLSTQGIGARGTSGLLPDQQEFVDRIQADIRREENP